MSSRNKPRYKIAYQSGYNVLGKKNFDNLNRKKWRQIKKRETFKPKFAAVVPVRNLYGQRLRSKQALKSLYGKMTERQFKKFYDNSEFGNTRSNINLKGLLERRLDNFITRIGFTSTVLKGRQSILHGCFKVNGKIIKSPSYIVRVNDCVTPSEKIWEQIYSIFYKRSIKRLENKAFLNKVKRKNKYNKSKRIDVLRPILLPNYVEFDYSTLTAIVIHEPKQTDVSYKGHFNFKHLREYYV